MSPLNTKAPGPSLIYLVEPLAISDHQINICVRPPNTYTPPPPNLAFHPFEVDKMSTRSFWELNGKK